LDRVAPKVAPQLALDLGTGSAVLAIAAVKATHYQCRVTAVDIDPVAIAVARENCLKNGVARHVSLHTGNGITPARAYADRPFDLVLANILAKPLLSLAPRLQSLLRLGGVAILSGLLTGQAREVAARYSSAGFSIIEKRELEGWATLVLCRTT
jgi:ribosomal protein L11 methyltransferase